jgi:cation transport ATPase
VRARLDGRVVLVGSRHRCSASAAWRWSQPRHCLKRLDNVGKTVFAGSLHASGSAIAGGDHGGGGELLGRIAWQHPQAHQAEAVARLTERGLDVWMITGR